ncbi:hypothetical protein BJ928_13132 [Rhizobium sp. WW_1]|jgi:hypothetical protein|nr:hypothetical protein BJ928_13132 [Rhizobium sp. WW_1]
MAWMAIKWSFLDCGLPSSSTLSLLSLWSALTNTHYASLGAEIARSFMLESGAKLTPKLGLTGGFSGLDGSGEFGTVTAGMSLFEFGDRLERQGYEGSKLGYLMSQSGYFHEGHRAVDDCFALLEVLALAAGDAGSSPLAELYRASQRSRVRIFAENAPFDLKDRLKARGYRWSDGSDGRPKSWWLEVDEDDRDEELRFLRNDIYRWDDADPPIQRLTAFDRFKVSTCMVIVPDELVRSAPPSARP